MPIYTYQAKKGPGKVLEGQIEAANREEAIANINSQGLFIVSLEEKSPSRKGSFKVPARHLMDFTHQLSTLINSGSPLLTSLNTLASQTEQESLKPILDDVISQVKDGHDFSYALNKYPRVFPQLYISLVQIGETSGTLGDNLRRLAEFLEEEMEFKANIISVLTYPALIFFVGIATILTLLKFVIPKLVNIFEELGQVLPLPTLFLIRISDIFSRFGILIILFLAGLFFAGRKYLRDPRNKLRWDRMKLKIPLVGSLLKKMEICHMARTLHTLFSNGVSIDSSLRVASRTVSNSFIREEVVNMEKEITEGSSLAEAMKSSGIFSPAFINVITVGEDSGQLASVLSNLAVDYSKDINRSLKRLINLLEPALILGVGMVVGFVVLSMLLPIFQIDFNL